MILYSTLGNYGVCPIWGVSVTVLGKYKERPDGRWEFMSARCPIIENSKLPRYEQNPEMELMSCQNPCDCPLYTEFQTFVTEII